MKVYEHNTVYTGPWAGRGGGGVIHISKQSEFGLYVYGVLATLGGPGHAPPDFFKNECNFGKLGRPTCTTLIVH